MESIKDFVYHMIMELKGESLNPKLLDDQFNEVVVEIYDYKEKREDPYYICENTTILNLFNISWLESEDEISPRDLHYLIGLFVTDSMNFETYRAIIRKLYSKAIIDENDIVSFYWVYITKMIELDKKGSLNFSSYLDFCREMGLLPLKAKRFHKYLKEIDSDLKISDGDMEKDEDLDRHIKNLTEREEYIEEIAKSLPANLLDKLDNFVSIETLNKLAYYQSKNISQLIEIEQDISIAELQVLIEKKFTENNFPIVPSVVDPIFQPHLSKVKAKSVKMEDLTHYPSEQVREFASIKAYSSPSIAHKIRIIFLGGGGIGNMGIILQHDNNAILLDFGMSVANNSIPKWHPSLNFVNSVLVTHAHLDHTGALPYLISPESGKRWYSSPSTRILAEKLLYNTAAITRINDTSEQKRSHVLASFLNTSRIVNLFNVFNPLKTKETVEISPGFEVTPHSASHLFGSYSYEVNIFGTRILFTGDFSMDECELFPGAKLPTDCDVTIFDGTYYNRELPKEDPNTVIMKAAETTERLIIPAFSLGRTQEMIKRLERLGITKKKSVQTTGLAADISKTMGIKADYDIHKSIHPDDFEKDDVVVAGHGMMQAGTARDLIDATKEDDKTGILICGYQAPNTLGYALKTSHPVAKQKYNQKIFSAHISGHTTPPLLDEFIAKLNGKKLMVHTPKNVRLKKEHKEIVIPSYLQEIIVKKN